MSDRIGEIAVKKGLLSADRLREALLIQQSGDRAFGIEPGQKIGRILLAKRYMEPMALIKLLYEQKGNVDFIYIASYIVEPRVALWLPQTIAEKHSILPLVSMDEETLIVASARAVSPAVIKGVESLIKK